MEAEIDFTRRGNVGPVVGPSQGRLLPRSGRRIRSCQHRRQLPRPRSPRDVHKRHTHLTWAREAGDRPPVIRSQFRCRLKCCQLCTGKSCSSSVAFVTGDRELAPGNLSPVPVQVQQLRCTEKRAGRANISPECTLLRLLEEGHKAGWRSASTPNWGLSSHMCLFGCKR